MGACTGKVEAERVRDTRLLRRGDTRLSALDAPSRGSFESALPPLEEGRRDFARIFFADERKIYVMGRGMPHMRPVEPTLAPSKANIGDLSEQVVQIAEDRFTECLSKQLAQVFGRPPDSTLVATLRARATAAMTVNVGLDFAVHMGLMPTFLQPFFLIILIPELSQARIATYGFVAVRPADVIGDRPDCKRTPYCVRLLSPNLLQPAGASEGWWVEYSLRTVASPTIKRVVEGDLSLVREAIRTAQWDALT
mmetsp:Transcript_68566/g.178571  ORF Transcript_68566/g.178571 Transcript_68566/m.178571 type:complete len:252 (+) Transcript_68566:87-842(+)